MAVRLDLSEGYKPCVKKVECHDFGTLPLPPVMKLSCPGNAGLDEAGERGCRGGCDIFIQDAAGQSSRCTDHSEADGHRCLATWPQQGRASSLSGLSVPMNWTFSVFKTSHLFYQQQGLDLKAVSTSATSGWTVCEDNTEHCYASLCFYLVDSVWTCVRNELCCEVEIARHTKGFGLYRRKSLGL